MQQATDDGGRARASRLLIAEPPLQVLPGLAAVVGLNEAIILQQLEYWLWSSTHVHDGERWVYNTLSQWRQQFPFWSEDTIKRTFRKLRESGLVVTAKLATDTRDRTNWYRIDRDRLGAILHEHEGKLPPSNNGAACPAPSGQIAPVLNVTTETTTETTSRENGRRSYKSADEPLGFPEWLAFHAELTGQRVAAPATKARAELARKFGVLVGEGRSLDDFKLASTGAHSDEWLRENGKCRPENILIYDRIDGLIEKGQKATSKRQAPAMVRTKATQPWEEEL